MWCARCEQDVPGLVSPQSRGLICIRCGEKVMHSKEGSQVPLHTKSAHPHPHFPEDPAQKGSASAAPSLPPPASRCSEGLVLPVGSFLGYDDWEMDRALKHIGRQVRPHLTPISQTEKNRRARLDAPHPLLRETHWALGKDCPSPAAACRPTRYAQIFLYGAIILLTCGLVLLLWCYLGGRPELQRWGWPCVVIGQAGLLVGMYFQPSQRKRFPAPKEPTSASPECLTPTPSPIPGPRSPYP